VPSAPLRVIIRDLFGGWLMGVVSGLRVVGVGYRRRSGTCPGSQGMTPGPRGAAAP